MSLHISYPPPLPHTHTPHAQSGSQRVVYHSSATEETAFHLAALLNEDVRASVAAASRVQIIWSEDAAMCDVTSLGLTVAEHYIVLSSAGPSAVRVALGSRTAFPPGPLADGMCLPNTVAAHMVRVQVRACRRGRQLESVARRRAAVARVCSGVYFCFVFAFVYASLIVFPFARTQAAKEFSRVASPAGLVTAVAITSDAG